MQFEPDAIIDHLYGLNTEDMRYILDPEDVCGPGCVNENFPRPQRQRNPSIRRVLHQAPRNGCRVPFYI